MMAGPVDRSLSAPRARITSKESHCTQCRAAPAVGQQGQDERSWGLAGVREPSAISSLLFRLSPVSGPLFGTCPQHGKPQLRKFGSSDA